MNAVKKFFNRLFIDGLSGMASPLLISLKLSYISANEFEGYITAYDS